MVVESDERQREGLGRALRAGGHEVLEAADAGAAMCIMSTARPALLVVGDGPFGSTGTQMMRALGRLPGDRVTPPVLIAGSTPVDATGVTLGLQKPFRVEDLLRAVERYAEDRRPE